MDILAIGLALSNVLSGGAASLCDKEALRIGLERRAQADAAARTAYIKNPDSREAEALVIRLDAEHRLWLRPVLEQCGWPTERMVGRKASRGAWLIAQHADMDPAFQVFAASKLKEVVVAGEAAGRPLASLVDRNRRMQKMPQVYGMQFRTEAGVTSFLPIEDPAALDARRAEIGLEPFACWYATLQTGDQALLQWPEGVPRGECEDAL